MAHVARGVSFYLRPLSSDPTLARPSPSPAYHRYLALRGYGGTYPNFCIRPPPCDWCPSMPDEAAPDRPALLLRAMTRHVRVRDHPV